MIAFRVGAFDSEVLEKEFAPTFMAVDLVNLGFAQVYMKLMIDGVSSQPFSATTIGPIAKPNITFKDKVIESSRLQFARPRSQVEKGILDWHDAGTAREVRPQSPSQTSNNSSLPSVPKNPPPSQDNSAEQAKQVFMKAAEELRQKEKQQERPQEMSFERPRERERFQTNNQPNNPQKEKDRKNPTNENISSLKSALASVISKPAAQTSRPEPVKPKESPKPAPVPNVSSSTKEVPEDVLRELLQ
jgi:hypothetical protein